MVDSLRKKLSCERLEDRRLLAASGWENPQTAVSDGLEADDPNSPTAQHPGSVHGRKWEDLNGSGEIDFGEPGLAAVTIYSDLNYNGRLNEGEPRTVSMADNPLTDYDETGIYWLEGLQPGYHLIREVVPAGFEQTFPSLPPGHRPPPWGDAHAHLVFVEEVGIVEGINFGNRRLHAKGSIHGVKWEDLDGDSVRDPAEPALPGVVIYADLNRNGRLEPDEPHTVSMDDDPTTPHNEAGRYWLRLEPGEYLIREVVPDGYEQTFPLGPAGLPRNPASDGHVADVFSEVHPEAIHAQLDVNQVFITEAKITIHPFLFRPIQLDVVAPLAHIPVVNLSGVQTNGGGGQTSAFEVQITGDGSAHEFDLQIIDAETGDLHGTIPVFINSAVSGPAHFVVLRAGDVVEGIDFGNRRLRSGSIHGVKWQDANGNGRRDPQERGLPGVVVYADLNRNGRMESHEPHTLTMRDNPNTRHDEGGRYWLDLAPGEYLIREVVPTGYRQTFPSVKLDSGLPSDRPDRLNDDVTIRPDVIRAELNAGESLVSEVAMTVHPSIFAPIEIDVIAPAANIPVLNLSGVQINGGSGETSVFEIMILGDGSSHEFELQLIDPTTGNVFGAVPVFINSSIRQGAHFVALGPGETVDGIDFGNQPLRSGSVHGRKWEDKNGNRERDHDEPGLAGVTIYSDINHNGELDPDEPHTVTMPDAPSTDFDETGLYWLKGLEPGNHVIREIVPTGFFQTFPEPIFLPARPTNPDAPLTILPPISIPGWHQVVVEPGGTLDGIDFGNRRAEPGIVAGVKWEDLNGNGQREDTEPGLAGVTIYSDLNFNGELDDNEPFAVSSEDNPETPANELGRYRMEVPFGFNVIGEIVPDGYEPTFPLSPFLSPLPFPGGAVHGIYVAPGQIVQNIDFGNRPLRLGSVHGVKWHDLNGNGLRENNEPGLAGVVIYSDANFNGKLDEGERRTTTMEDDPDTDFDETGLYWLDDLAPGDHFIREVIPESFVQTFPGAPFFDSLVPGNGFHEVLLEPGGAVDNVNFGNQELVRGQIHGRKWEDLDGDGQQDADEPGLAGVTIYSDLNFNGALDAGEPRTVSMEDDPQTRIDESGIYWLQELRPGHHSIREIVPAGFQQTFPMPVIIAGEVDATIFPPPPVTGSHEVLLRNGETLDGVDFGNQRIIPATVHGVKWLDADGDGERDRGEPGLAGVVIYSDLNFNGALDEGEPRTRTHEDSPLTADDETGSYWLENLRPGAHLIREVVPAGFQATFPQDDSAIGIPQPGGHFVFLASGQEVDGIDFGNRPILPATVQGRKWLDGNGNGQRDADEGFLAGVTIYSDLNRNGMFDPDEPHAVTMEENPFTDFDEGGLYVLSDLRPGFHLIREVLPAGHLQTFPSPRREIVHADAHHVTLEAGDVVEGLDFGNRKIRAETNTMPGDFDRDGTVSDRDFLMWKHTYGSQENLLADANGDGVVNSADYTVLRNNMGRTMAVAGSAETKTPPALAASVATQSTSDHALANVAATAVPLVDDSSSSLSETGQLAGEVSGLPSNLPSRILQPRDRAAANQIPMDAAGSSQVTDDSAQMLQHFEQTVATMKQKLRSRDAALEHLGPAATAGDHDEGESLSESLTPAETDAVWATWN